MNHEDPVTIGVEQVGDQWKLHTNLYQVLPEMKLGVISTETLGMAFEPEQKFENPDGTPIRFNVDFFGNHRPINPLAGPFASAPEESEPVA